MGRRDYRTRELKKPKKDARKPNVSAIISQVPMVEVIKTKGKKEQPAEEGQ